ncbi:MAG TPA: MBL fold metallo-hydrolase [Anaerolineae bacterium]|nr:MBL fold metallo-hydrolase [Anaerolineae bacterium]
MLVEILPVGMLQTNCYLAGCEETRAAVIIDPGGHPQRILGAVERHGLTVKYVLNTHGHFDHTDANKAIVEATGAPLAAHALERPLLQAAGGAAMFGLAGKAGPEPDIDLKDGDELVVGTLRFQVLHAPGHTPGHICFYEDTEKVLFDGDVLFYRGIGRADLPGGDPEQLLASIHRVLYTLPDETTVYSGHGQATTIGEEKRHNPWVRG